MKKLIVAFLAFQFALYNTSLAQITPLLHFAGTTNGSYPNASLISVGTFLYGMTNEGGTNDYSTIFKIMPDGTSYVKIFELAPPLIARYPYGSLYFDGTCLYGTTLQGGTNDLGTIFKIMPDGTRFVKLLTFVGNVTNILGEVVLSKKINLDVTFNIDISNQPAGIYFLRVGNSIQKIIKQ